MKNGSKEPDWGKFGLDGEKQPLNPVASTKVEPAKPSGDLYGGQVVDDNELFADDQVSLKIKVFCYFWKTLAYVIPDHLYLDVSSLFPLVKIGMHSKYHLSLQIWSRIKSGIAIPKQYLQIDLKSLKVNIPERKVS